MRKFVAELGTPIERQRFSAAIRRIDRTRKIRWF